MAANKLVHENKVTTGNQYIDVPYHWVQELRREKKIVVPYVKTKINIADITTKSVTKEVIDTLVNKTRGYETKWLGELISQAE